jgi:uncharacterized protein YbaP (TraB family)
MSDTLTKVIPSATPTDEEIAAWNELPRDEQLRRLRLDLTHPDACVPSTHSMADIWAKIRERRNSPRRDHD